MLCPVSTCQKGQHIVLSQNIPGCDCSFLPFVLSLLSGPPGQRRKCNDTPVVEGLSRAFHVPEQGTARVMGAETATIA